MTFQDKTLECYDCGSEFTFTADEQEFFHSKGYMNDPKRCPDCRQARKARRTSESGYGGQRKMFPVVCAECGRDTEVPFEPREERPVYCSDCYRKVRQAR